MEQSWVADYL